MKTIDTIHEAGFTDGNIGFQLCHGYKHTIIDKGFVLANIVMIK